MAALWSDQDVDRLYNKSFVPRQLESVVKHSRMIPGVLDTRCLAAEAGHQDRHVDSATFAKPPRSLIAKRPRRAIRPINNVDARQTYPPAALPRG